MWPSHPDKTPQFFAWLTGAGIYHGKLEFEDQKPGDSLDSEKTLIAYNADTHVEMAPPVGMALTQFHCVLLYRDRWVGQEENWVWLDVVTFNTVGWKLYVFSIIRGCLRTSLTPGYEHYNCLFYIVINPLLLLTLCFLNIVSSC